MSREQRPIFLQEEDAAEPGHYGCPMLSTSRQLTHLSGKVPTWRCALGWAVRSESDAQRCGEVGQVSDCWRVQLERKPVTPFVPVAREAKASAD